ncbi:unnamed protein product [Mortierella alpina]
MSFRSLIARHQRTSTRVSVHSLQAVAARAFSLSSHTRGYYNSYSNTGDHNDNGDKTTSKKPETTSQKPPSSKALDPDTIKGPGGLTMTQIGKLVQESRAKDMEQKALRNQQQQQQRPGSSKESK